MIWAWSTQTEAERQKIDARDAHYQQFDGQTVGGLVVRASAGFLADEYGNRFADLPADLLNKDQLAVYAAAALEEFFSAGGGD